MASAVRVGTNWVAVDETFYITESAVGCVIVELISKQKPITVKSSCIESVTAL